MFAWWGRTVYRYRFIVIGVMVALCLGGGLFGMSLGDHVTQSGFYDEGSQSVKASILGDDVYGRDRTSHIVAVFTAPKGETVDDQHWFDQVKDGLDAVKKDNPDQVLNWVGYFTNPEQLHNMADSDKKHAFVSIQLKGDDDDTILKNYQKVEPALQKLDGGTVKLAGMEPIADALTGTIATDQKRMEILALPLVAIVLFFVFGGVIAAALPVIVGGLSIAGSMGILRVVAIFGPVHFFAQPVVSLIGLGIAIDYGLFVVSRFREEIAEGYDTEAAVRRSVMTAGRTVVFSAVLIIASSASLLVLPQGFVRALTYAIFASVGLAALLSITLLPACLGVLGTNIDALGVRTLYRVPFLRNWEFSNRIIGWFAEKTQKTKTREEVEAGFWGKLVNFVMKRPLTFAIPIVIAMILLIIPLGKLTFGAMSEKYLPPDNSTRVAQEAFDKIFPGYRTEKLTLVIESTTGKDVTDQQIAEVRSKAMAISGFVEPDDDPADMWKERPYLPGASKEPTVRVIQNGLISKDDAAKKIAELRQIPAPKGLDVMVGGTPALEQDSIHSLVAKAPLMLVILLTATTLLMFLAFGSLVLPLKAAVMSALTLGSTMGILTWMFVDGHGSGLLNFTPTPLMVVIIALVVAVGYGLATDYEVFLVSRMVEARESGMSTTEAIRIGTATTGRLITAAALILAVVAASFVFSDLVMMKYLAFGLMAALLLDATVIRMFLVPAVMKLLGDDCWWAPRWMKKLQNRIGLGEIRLPDERKRRVTRGIPAPTPVPAGATAGASARQPHDPTHPAPHAERRPQPVDSAPTRPVSDRSSSARTTRMPAGPEAATTRFAAPATERIEAAKPAPEREIESWLGELRGDTGGRPRERRGATIRREPESERPAPPPAGPPGPDADATTAFPAQENRDNTATEKIDGQSDAQRRGASGGVSAAELLRREGRY
ncbi:MMPL family transporter [Mycobacterium sp. M1]|uniref:MMPL family transporter n=1 Tax=Mycolicibacter acidiphilus TaxID=2835306 RepID=A0ABS5RG53_9MYCO|nr:MMPL family transporter [Mycolicibacter acidiphilus]MBS9533265.1 MMPL family transporter [Mycolicibacter acidiphilus]